MESPLDLVANVFALAGAICVVAAVPFFRPEPVIDWREVLFKPFWLQRDHFRRPGYSLFIFGLWFVAVRVLVSIAQIVMPA